MIGLFTCLASAIVLRRDINLRRAGALLLAAAIGLVPGVWVARTMPASWLNIMIGAITLAALAATALLRTLTLFQGTRGVVVAGSLSGFMNVTAGIGGPPIVVYAATTGWPHREYLATMQLYFTGLSILSLAGRGLPDLPPAGWVIAAGSATLGLVIGNLAQPQNQRHPGTPTRLCGGGGRLSRDARPRHHDALSRADRRRPAAHRFPRPPTLRRHAPTGC